MELSSLVVMVIVGGLAVVFALDYKKRKANTIPGPAPLPILGNTVKCPPVQIRKVSKRGKFHLILPLYLVD